jgi:hypothetical protein
MDNNFELAIRNLETATNSLFEAVMYRSNFITDDDDFTELYNSVRCMTETIRHIIDGSEGGCVLLLGTGADDGDEMTITDLLVMLGSLRRRYKLEHEYAEFRAAVAAVIAVY